MLILRSFFLKFFKISFVSYLFFMWLFIAFTKTVQVKKLIDIWVLILEAAFLWLLYGGKLAYLVQTMVQKDCIHLLEAKSLPLKLFTEMAQ